MSKVASRPQRWYHTAISPIPTHLYKKHSASRRPRLSWNRLKALSISLPPAIAHLWPTQRYHAAFHLLVRPLRPAVCLHYREFLRSLALLRRRLQRSSRVTLRQHGLLPLALVPPYHSDFGITCFGGKHIFSAPATRASPHAFPLWCFVRIAPTYQLLHLASGGGFAVFG